MTTLEKIRAEIAEFEERIADLPNMADAYAAVWHCLDIIEKYAEQEPCDDAISRPTVVKFEGTNMACMGGDEIMKEFEPQESEESE